MSQQDVSDETIERFRQLPVATIYGGVRALGHEPCFMEGVRSFTPGRKLVARARTLRFLPPRADIAKETRRGEDSPEYRAMASCGPNDALVCDAMGRRYSAVGRRSCAAMVGAAGVVTDGGIRADTTHCRCSRRTDSDGGGRGLRRYTRSGGSGGDWWRAKLSCPGWSLRCWSGPRSTPFVKGRRGRGRREYYPTSRDRPVGTTGCRPVQVYEFYAGRGPDAPTGGGPYIEAFDAKNGVRRCRYRPLRRRCVLAVHRARGPVVVGRRRPGWLPLTWPQLDTLQKPSCPKG